MKVSYIFIIILKIYIHPLALSSTPNHISIPTSYPPFFAVINSSLSIINAGHIIPGYAHLLLCEHEPAARFPKESNSLPKESSTSKGSSAKGRFSGDPPQFVLEFRLIWCSAVNCWCCELELWGEIAISRALNYIA